ncbi:tRNA (adenine(22)-N(1))-methyltransferase [Streptococcus ruminantium]|uniref:tRNA (adenine(22)-N(1))-methyltransferase n=1 Tax=Streptococcus ruminantium TaxID=1917441 RepID=UPI0012DF382C|nr:tRNA (adenine(22)-N(1))-methyltransferase TrmK [Streptococcus ruminantium]MDQ8819794.1 tRNA (adenine(22)-N(1))-methyltransferase TrmK [Streptococcus ruminantium]MDQ8837364.1 tRNA (adenine(22)-N(1))-methyltransferase TrmK [Streptococcus ruminantium]BDD39022.1 SAM-dependent methyltransferase [Streptococcus ruminantium]BDD40564.1 SAM-dependent methyltransferase [Streptococcus ruminantium]BDD42884.1 SAM-dependent methyltransferase [Streptococcus ruminantium]
METKLSKRLETVASFVPKGARLVDVGSDHAYLPLFLVEQGQVDFAIAGEVVQGPYRSALQNVEQAGKLDKIQVRLANGLAAVEVADNITAITIAGMGGRLIADILEAGKDKLANVERLILQPNNREDDVRRWLEKNQFKLIAEEILEENGKFYEVLVAESGQMKLLEIEHRFGPYLLEQKSSIFIKKWHKEQEKLKVAFEQIPLECGEDRLVIFHKIKQIEEALYVSE